MKLFLLSQNENDGYDTHDAVVVAAKDEASARMIVPGGNKYDEAGKTLDRWGSWAHDLSNVSVRLIGTAIPGTKKGIILESFNAG